VTNWDSVVADRSVPTSTSVKPWVRPVALEIANQFGPLYYVWGYSSKGSGEHPLGRAIDFSVLEKGNGVSDPGPARPALGNDIANYLWANRARLNVWYVIWNRRIISTNPDSYAYNEWVPYNGESPHTDHVHVSFESSGTYAPPEDQEEDMDSTQDARLKRVEAQVGSLYTALVKPGPTSLRDGKSHNLGFFGAHADRNAFDAKAILQQKVPGWLNDVVTQLTAQNQAILVLLEALSAELPQEVAETLAAGVEIRLEVDSDYDPVADPTPAALEARPVDDNDVDSTK